MAQETRTAASKLKAAQAELAGAVEHGAKRGEVKTMGTEWGGLALLAEAPLERASAPGMRMSAMRAASHLITEEPSEDARRRALAMAKAALEEEGGGRREVKEAACEVFVGAGRSEEAARQAAEAGAISTLLMGADDVGLITPCLRAAAALAQQLRPAEEMDRSTTLIDAAVDKGLASNESQARRAAAKLIDRLTGHGACGDALQKHGSALARIARRKGEGPRGAALQALARLARAYGRVETGNYEASEAAVESIEDGFWDEAGPLAEALLRTAVEEAGALASTQGVRALAGATDSYSCLIALGRACELRRSLASVAASSGTPEVLLGVAERRQEGERRRLAAIWAIEVMTAASEETAEGAARAGAVAKLGAVSEEPRGKVAERAKGALASLAAQCRSAQALVCLVRLEKAVDAVAIAARRIGELVREGHWEGEAEFHRCGGLEALEQASYAVHFGDGGMLALEHFRQLQTEAERAQEEALRDFTFSADEVVASS